MSLNSAHQLRSSHPDLVGHESSASQNRRSRNTAHRANDIEFATEIGQSLLIEVRRLQTLLAERDKAIEDLSRDVQDGQTREESMRELVRSLEGIGGEFIATTRSALQAKSSETHSPHPFEQSDTRRRIGTSRCTYKISRRSSLTPSRATTRPRLNSSGLPSLTQLP